MVYTLFCITGDLQMSPKLSCLRNRFRTKKTHGEKTKHKRYCHSNCPWNPPKKSSKNLLKHIANSIDYAPQDVGPVCPMPNTAHQKHNENIQVLMVCYTMQIYFDFSGYCDIALGIGYLFNVELPLNFNSPYKAASIVEFWGRWHMTLTRFFTKYVYIPFLAYFSSKNKLPRQSN